MKLHHETWWTASALGARAIGQLALTLAATLALPPAQASLWFIFASLGALVQLLDMGLAPAVMRSASHLWAGAPGLKPQGVDAASTLPNLPALKDLRATMSAVYTLLALAIVTVGVTLGQWSLGPLIQGSDEQAAWQIFCLAAALQLMVSERYNTLQGAGRLIKAQKIFSLGAIVSWGLAAATIGITHSLLAGCAALAVGWTGQYLLFGWATRQLAGGRISLELLRAVWPNAWRGGLSRLSLAVIYYAPAVILGRWADLHLGGQYGFSVQLCLFITAIAQVPMAAATPQLHLWAAQGDIIALKNCFYQKLRASLVIYTALCVVMVAVGPWALDVLGARAGLLPVGMLAALAGFYLVELQRNNFILIVSAFNEAPFWKYDLISALLCALGSLWLAGTWGGWGVILGLIAIQSGWNFHRAAHVGLGKLHSSWPQYMAELAKR